MYLISQNTSHVGQEEQSICYALLLNEPAILHLCKFDKSSHLDPQNDDLIIHNCM